MSSIFLPLSQHRVRHCQPVWKNLCPLFKEWDIHIRTSSVAQTANDRHIGLQPCSPVKGESQFPSGFPSITTTLPLVKDFFMCRLYLAVFGFFYLVSRYKVKAISFIQKSSGHWYVVQWIPGGCRLVKAQGLTSHIALLERAARSRGADPRH